MENDVRMIDANALNFQYAHMIYPDGTESLGYHAYVTSVQSRCDVHGFYLSYVGVFEYRCRKWKKDKSFNWWCLWKSGACDRLTACEKPPKGE